MKKIIYILLFCSLSVFSQNELIDSLKRSLKNLPTSPSYDTIRCNLLDAMIEAESDDAIWPQYNDELLQLAESKLKTTKQTTTEYKFYKKKLAVALSNIGYIAKQQNDVPKALMYFNKSHFISKDIGDKEGIANSLNNLGSIYNSQGNITEALECYSKSIRIQELIGHKSGLATSLNNIGGIYQNQGDITKALEYHTRSLKIREEIGEKEGIAYSLNSIGIIYLNKGDRSFKSISKEDRRKELNTALEYMHRSLIIREEIGDKFGISNSLHNIGIIYHMLGDVSKALEYFKRGLNIQEDVGDNKGVAHTLASIGDIHFLEKNYQKALESANRSMLISKNLGYPKNIRNAAELLYKIHKAIGNYKPALENQELFIRMRDSLNNLETQKASIKQQTKYEYDKQKAVEDERHAYEIKQQEEKAAADKKRQYLIIGSVSLVLVIVAIFSILLYNRFKTAQKQKQVIELKEKETQQQKHIIEEKQKEILDSINYAKRIQYTLLAHNEFLKENLHEHFTYFNPKDIVSGDFYWAAKKENKFYLAVCDSTGHGVPGAFMSLLNIGFLSEAINEKGIEKPNEVFNFVRQRLIDNISKEGQQDGFDGILICIDHTTKQITYAAANNNPVLIQNNELIELEADRMPVGIGERKDNFKLHTINAKPGDILYLYTDGFADQFGGPKGKKFKYKQLNELLIKHHVKPLNEQQNTLSETFENWKGDLEQVDDVCVIGIKI